MNWETSEYLLAGILAALVVLILIDLYNTFSKAGPDAPGWLRTLRLEPVRVRTAILALVAVAGSFGLPVSETQQAGIVAAVLAVLAIFSEVTRAKVSPVARIEAETETEA